jgi:predicted DNA binding protein
VSRLRLGAAHAEIELLRLAIRRLADQDATLSVCDGAVTVTMDATLTDEEREAIELAASACGNCNGFGGDPTRPAIYRGDKIAATLRALLERLPTQTIHRQNDHIPEAGKMVTTLTDEERVAVDWAADFLDGREVADILRNLLERTK